ncbi:hypothetical protein M3Y99_01173400 [Aphelenchoides fujianensis]|nr:hypothetical protein M3Y99_01173400 [Aphelenchoides fujianensis]
MPSPPRCRESDGELNDEAGASTSSLPFEQPGDPRAVELQRSKRLEVAPRSSPVMPTAFVPRPLLLDIKWLLRLFLLLTLSTVSSAGIGCFVCSSFNRSNPDCEDQFNSSVSYPAASTASTYQFPCWAFKKERKGLFPADHCVKVSGYQSDNPSQTLVIRTCALDSGTLTADTEIVRLSHCGHFRYEGKQYTGCVVSCATDGCNFAVGRRLSAWLLAALVGGLFASFRS